MFSLRHLSKAHKQFFRQLISLREELVEFRAADGQAAARVEIRENVAQCLKVDPGFLPENLRNRFLHFLESLQDEDAGNPPVDDLLEDLDVFLNRREFSLSPWTIFLGVLCLALVGGILTLNQLTGKVLFTIKNVGCPVFLVGDGLSPRVRGTVHDMGIILPDSVSTNEQESFSLPAIPVSARLMVSGRSRLEVQIIDTRLEFPLPADVDQVLFNGEDVTRGPITYRLDHRVRHEIVLICP